MAVNSHVRSLACGFKRLRISPPAPSIQHQSRCIQHQSLSQGVQNELAQLRLPRAVQATYVQPLKHAAPPDAPLTCQLQLRSYSLRNLEVFADFALRAAYFLRLCARGPKMLPRLTERWTVPKSNFIYKKSQENFERITLRREIKILGGHPEIVSIWLAFIKKHQYYGVGMKANMWDYSGLDVAETLDAEAETMTKKLEERVQLFGKRKSLLKKKNEQNLQDAIHDGPFRAAWGGYAPLAAAQNMPPASTRFDLHEVERTQTS